MNPWLVLPPAGILLAGLLWFESRGPRAGVLAFKTPLSVLFVITASAQAFSMPLYHGLLLAGLVFCLLGDVLLALPGDRAFLAGLVGFLLGHLLYGAAFFGTAGLEPSSLVALFPLAAAGWGVWRWLRPRLNGMRTPVAMYIVVISVMACGAFGFLGEDFRGGPGRFLVVGGAAAFYLSDLFVARDRFVRKGVENRWVGLPLYYAGQFMLAFSPGLLA
jgi:uncharacterized membrane protein YhhN